MLEAKAPFKVVICVYDLESFKHLFTIVMKYVFVTKVQFEFAQYMASVTEGTSSLKGPMEELVLFYAYLFPCKIGIYIQDILGMRKLPALILHLTSSFPKDLCLYKYEILPEVLLKIMLPILHGNLICLSIFGSGVVTYVCMVSYYFFNGAIETKSLTTF